MLVGGGLQKFAVDCRLVEGSTWISRTHQPLLLLCLPCRAIEASSTCGKAGSCDVEDHGRNRVFSGAASSGRPRVGRDQPVMFKKGTVLIVRHVNRCNDYF